MDDCKFYEHILKEYEGEEDIKVFKISSQDAAEKGGNFVSKVDRITICGSKQLSDYRTSLILKQFFETPTTKMFKFQNIYQNEIIYYKEILPNLRKYSKHMMDAPKCLYVGDFFIYEDLNQLGFELKPKGHRYSIDEAKLVLKEVAKLHSASLSIQQNQSKIIEDFRTKLRHILNRDGNDLLEKCILDHYNTAIKVFESMKNAEVVSILDHLKSDTYFRLVDLLEKPTEIKVLNHGDLWGNNIFSQGVDIKIIDYQMCFYSSPAVDITYFLWLNIDPKVRKNHLKELLSYYVENLRKFSNENNISEETMDKLTLQWIQNEYNAFSLYGLMYTFLFLPILFTKVEVYMGETEVEVSADTFYSLMNESYRETLVNSVLEYVDIQKGL